MKTVILAGGLGTRLSEETDARLKPMVEIGGKPILWHRRWNRILAPEAKSRDVLLTTGATLELAMAMREKQEYSGCEVCTLPLWGMISKALQVEQVRMRGHIFTIEDHLEDGGFGSWLSEALNREPLLCPHLRSFALSSNVCGLVGSQATLNTLGGLG